MTYTQETYTFATFKKIPLQATFYRPAATIPYQATLLYFHGGGLIFGQRGDLPEIYLTMLTKAGYGILAVDYLLAPETKLDLIIDHAQAAVDWFLAAASVPVANKAADTPKSENTGDSTHAAVYTETDAADSQTEKSKELTPETNNQHARNTKLKLPHSRYYLFGRSAGTYLALYLAAHHEQRTYTQQAEGIIALYGYFNLNEASFSIPSRHFLQFNTVPERSIQKLIRQVPLVTGPMAERFVIYLAARQAGDWIPQLLPKNASARDYSLTPANLKTLPKTFIAAGVKDPDVPVRQSRLMSQHISESQLHVIDTAEHDFDRTQIETHGRILYEKILAWLSEL